MVDHVNEQLRRGLTEDVNGQRIQQLLNSAIIALHAASNAGVLTPANTASSPIHRRVAASAIKVCKSKLSLQIWVVRLGDVSSFRRSLTSSV